MLFKRFSFLFFQMLEYCGRGKSLVDVGLAQARVPLNTTSHYFEMEIVDPGRSGYITIGLTRKVRVICSIDSCRK